MEDRNRNQLLRRWELKCQLKELEAEKKKLEKELFPLYIAMHNEQVDVANLEEKNIRNWFLDTTGKKEAMLQKERREAAAAKLNYDTVSRQLEYTKQQLENARNELEQLRIPESGSWAEESDPQLIRQELRAALDTGSEARKDLESMIRKVDNLIEQNRWGVNKSMMPSYLATAQKQINLLKEEMDLFAQEASNLPIQESVLEPGVQLLILDDHLMDQAVAGMGADMLLGESHSALVACRKRLAAVLEALEKKIAQIQ